jgi:hypothetical protein
MLRRIAGPKRDEVMKEWRKLHNEQLRHLGSLPSVIRTVKARRLRWVGHVARMGEKRNTYRLVGKPEGKRPLGRPRRRWVDNISFILHLPPLSIPLLPEPICSPISFFLCVLQSLKC